MPTAAVQHPELRGKADGLSKLIDLNTLVDEGGLLSDGPLLFF